MTREASSINADNLNTSLFHRLLASTLAVLLFGSQAFGQTPIPGTPASDWATEIDIDPPVIDHEALESGVPGQAQQFTAVVVDDRGLKHVMLYHRDKAGTQYQSTEMTRPDASSSEFTASVDTALGQTRIEYYIEALDIGGNRVLKGFPFFPLVRQLDPLPGSITAAVTESNASQSRVVYVLLGVAAVGLALTLLNDDSEPTQSGNTVPLNIIISPP